jgi:hypothetical protein
MKLDALFGEQRVKISTYGEKADALIRIYQKMLYMDHDMKVTLLKKFLDQLGAQPASHNFNERTMLNWEEIIEMSKNGICFGAHTVTHPTLSKMPFERAKAEIRESKFTIEKQLRTPVLHFAIPNGTDKDFTAALRDFCRQEGFISIVSTNFGIVTKQSDPYNLPRVSPSESLYLFASELARLFIINK